MRSTSPEGIGTRSAPLRRRDLAWVELDGELVLYDELTHRVHRLNATAAVVWGLLDGSVTLGELSEELADAFGQDLARVTDEVLALVRELGSQGLLEDGVTDPGGAGRA